GSSPRSASFGASAGWPGYFAAMSESASRASSTKPSETYESTSSIAFWSSGGMPFAAGAAGVGFATSGPFFAASEGGGGGGALAPLGAMRGARRGAGGGAGLAAPGARAAPARARGVGGRGGGGAAAAGGGRGA